MFTTILLKLRKITFFFIAFLSLQSLTIAEVRFEIVKLPDIDFKIDKIYMVGSFNNWQTNDERYALKKNESGKYYINFPDSLNYIEYKFTRGSWETVEGNLNGMRPNRVYNKSTAKSNIVPIEIECWEDQFRYLIKVTSIPKNTPFDASLFISGNFNSWDASNKNYKLKKQKDGTYYVTVVTTLEKIQYKFTRGSWATVEGRNNGRAMHNRVISRNGQINRVVENEISTWEDLAYHVSVYDLILLFSAFQGLLLIIALLTIHDYNKDANRLLMWLIGITSLGLLSKILPNYREVFEAFPKIILFPEIILFLYAPLFYFYIQKLLTIPNKLSKIWYHFIPCILLIILYIPYFTMGRQEFIDKIIDKGLNNVFLGVGGVALLTNSYYWFVCRQILQVYKIQYSKSHSFEQNLQYLNVAIYINGACLCVWIFTCLGVVIGKILEIETIYFIEYSTDCIWLVFSAIPYFMGYFAIYQPEVFRLTQHVNFLHPIDNNVNTELINGSQSGISTNDSLTSDAIDHAKLNPIIEKLESYMNKEKPYVNPRLTLIELAEKLQIHPNLLSKIINEHFEKNFFDYVNTFRINEFKELIENTKFENYTLLGIAFEVGFNSKTAFNRSFKKLTNLTPSEYYYKVKGKSIKE